MKPLLCLALLLPLLATPLCAADPFDQSKVPLEVDTHDAKLTKIVLLAGSVSNKSGQHEYFAGCALLMNWLAQTPGVWPVMARAGWPKNEAIFKNAKAVVFYGDGGGKQPFVLDPAKWKVLEKLMAEGAGLVLMHQGVDFPKGPDLQILEWAGGVWRADIGCRGHWDMEFSQFPDHPVMHGVKPFKAPGDGWLYNLHFAPGLKGVTPLLGGAVPDTSRTTPDAKQHHGRDEIIAWAYERPGGGRSFNFTGLDLHQNWDIESHRRFVVNGILWAAKVEVPNDGAKVDLTPADLNRNLDDKHPKTEQKPTGKSAN